MKTNLDSENYKIFKDFSDSIALLKNENQIITAINTFCKHIDVTGIVNYMLTSFIDHKYYVPYNSVHNKIALFTSAKYEFSIIYNPPKNSKAIEQYLYSYTNDVYLCPLIDVQDSHYIIYEQNRSLYPDVLKSNAKLEIQTKGVFSKGKAISLKKFKHVLRLDESKSFMMLMVSSKDTPSSYTWEYNSTTLAPTRIALADIHIARLGTTSKILGNIGNETSIHLLKKLCDHTSHIIRWDALRALVDLDAEEGTKMLQKMASDTHPEVKVAALQSLELLNASV